MSSIRSILEEKLKRAYFNGSTDVIARENGVIPNNTKLGEVQIEVLVDQALLEISQIIDEAKPKLMSDTSLIYKKWSVEMILNEYQSNLKELLK